MAIPTTLSQIESNLSKIGLQEFPESLLTNLKVLKSGQDILFHLLTSEEEEFLTAVHLLSKVEANLFQLLPRAVVFCNEIDTCERLEALINKLSFNLDLKTVVIHDKGNSVKQRNVLYEGVDLVIGTPKRLGELYFQNGINLKELKFVFILESAAISSKGGLVPIMRIHESLPKCQKVVFVNKESEKLTKFLSEFLYSPKVVN